MKKHLLKIIAALFLAFITSYASAQTYTYSTKGPQGLTMTSQNRSGVNINYSINELTLNSLNYKGEEMSEISISAFQIPNDEGLPNLPRESRFFAIPQGSKAVLKVIRCEKNVIKDVNLAPALKIQSDNAEPNMDYVKDAKVYSTNASFPENNIEISEPTSLRGVDAVMLGITPFQYNPVTKELTVYTNIELNIDFVGGNGHFGEDRLRSPYWDPILEAELMNYNALPTIDYSARMQEWTKNREEGWEYLIITPNNDAWAEYANQLKEFRTRQGILTEVMRLDEMGVTNTTQLKTWFHNAYNTWEIAPVAVCLLGDNGADMTQYIPAITTSHPDNGSCITDNQYADPTGDNLPDMCFSRLVAQSEAELPVFVSKQLEYETQPCMDANYYHRPITALGWQTERWFQICSEVVGGYWRSQGKDPQRINAIYSGTPSNSWSSAQNTSAVTSYFGPTGLGYLPATPGELGNWTGGTGQQIVSAVNEGVFMLQHRDHGGETLWGEPSFNTSHIAQMNNVGKLPFVMSINCLTGKFNYSSNCLMEAFMRRTYNGQNAGAVGLLCPTETSYSFVNDVYVWGVYDLFDPQFLPDYGPYANYSGNWMPAFGNVAGKYFLNQSSWPYNQEDKDITFTMFTAHCDAFLRLFTEIPQEMEVTHPTVVLAGLSEVNITAPEGVTISLVVEKPEGGWTIIGVAQATGNPQNITIPAQVPPAEINIVCTGQNYLRYEDVMPVVPADGPYIVFDSKIINDENNNEQVDFSENVSLDVTMKNVGSENIDAFEAVLSTTSEYITLTNATAQYGSIASNSTGSLENAFSFTVANNIPNNTNIVFTITVNNGDEDFVSYFSIKAYAPIFKINDMSINDANGNGNGRLDAGEEAVLTFSFENKGMSTAPNALAVLQMMSPYISVEETDVIYPVVGIGESTASYNITVSESTPEGYSCPLNFDIAAGNYSATKDFMIYVGLSIIDFELGELEQEWTNDSNHPWTIDTQDPYEGTYCLKSGAIGNSSSTNLSYAYSCSSNDSISFYYKVSSEDNYDKLHFYIDNVEKGTWSGSIPWTKAIYYVESGMHTFKWSYTKDSSQTGGSDCAWIDYVSLPIQKMMAGTAGLDVNICDGQEAQLNGYAILHQSVEWSTAGDGSFSNTSIVDPIYTPGTQDLANREVVLTLTITGASGETITDELSLKIFESIDIMNAFADNAYCAQRTPQEVGIEVVGDYSSVRWTTSGDGSFENTNELVTTYTPGANDIATGQANLVATVKSMGCGPIEFEYDFIMNPAPEIEITTPELNICSNNEFSLGINATGASSNPASPISSDYAVVINGAQYEFNEGSDFITLPAIAEAGEYTYYVSSIQNGTCTTTYGESEKSFTINVTASPTISVDNPEQVICEDATAVLNFTFTGVAPFVIEATGLAGFTAEGNTYTMTLDPEESINAMLTKITDATGCSISLEQAIRITRDNIPDLPIIYGENEIDIYYTPVSTFTTTEAINSTFNWTLDPENAGALVSNGNNVDITWASTFTGNVSLMVIESNECGTSEKAALPIKVKNSTNVSESEIVSPNIYPNPANDELNIQIDGLYGSTKIEIFNILGERVLVESVTAENGLNAKLNVDQMSNGTYLVKIMTNEKTWVKNIVIKK